MYQTTSQVFSTVLNCHFHLLTEREIKETPNKKESSSEVEFPNKTDTDVLDMGVDLYSIGIMLQYTDVKISVEIKMTIYSRHHRLLIIEAWK